MWMFKLILLLALIASWIPGTHQKHFDFLSEQDTEEQEEAQEMAG